MSFWGTVFQEGRHRKETGQPQSWATHPPRWDLDPRNRAKRGSTENSLPHQSNNLPMFYQQLSKQCFPGLEKCHTLLFQKATAAAVRYPCKLLALLREVETLRFQTFLFPTPRGYPTWHRESKTMQRRSTKAASLSSSPWHLISEALLIWSQGPKGTRAIKTESKLQSCSTRAPSKYNRGLISTPKRNPQKVSKFIAA